MYPQDVVGRSNGQVRWRAVVAFAAAVGVFALASIGCGSDAPLDVAQGVDLGRFQGKWYEIARLPRATQADCYGTTAFYTRESDGSLTFVNQCNTDFAAGPLKTVAMAATVPDPSTPAKLALDVGGFSGDYWILEVDPSYAYAVVGHPSRSYLWILSRVPTLDVSTSQGILGRARANGFDTSQLQYTPQPPDAERLTASVPIGPVPEVPGQGCATAPGSPGGAPGWEIAFVAAVFARRRLRSAARTATIAR